MDPGKRRDQSPGMLLELHTLSHAGALTVSQIYDGVNTKTEDPL